MTLDALLTPRSIALLGASDHGAGARVRESLARLSFPGPVYLVNPRRAAVGGEQCYPTVADIGKPVDLAVFALGPTAVVPALEQCAGIGIPAAVVFANGFAETNPEGAERQARLADLAHRSGMSVLGPNCMGYVLPAMQRAVYLDHLWWPPRSGTVGLITQSGSVGIGALNHTGTLALSAMISVGNEAVVTAADVIDWLITDQRTRAIAMFMEDVSRIPALLESADRAAEAGIPVVACRSGRSERGALAVQTHTGALATEDRALRAVMQAHGIVVTEDLDELFAAAEILAGRRRVGRRLAGVTVSGGHVGLLHDLAAAADLTFPEPEAELAAAIETALGEVRAMHNPLDAWADADIAGGFDRALQALRGSGEYDSFLVIVDAPAQPPTSDPDLSLQFARSVTSAADGDDRLWTMVTSVVTTDDSRVTDLARDAGCPRLTGLRGAIAVIGAIARAREASQALAGAGQRHLPRAAWKIPAEEAQGYALLRSYGISTPESRLCGSAREALDAAAEIGYPVVAKIVHGRIIHKSSVGGVVLGIRDDAALMSACAQLAAAAPDDGGRILIASHVADGVDVLVGARYDRLLGPLLLIGAGGTMTELIEDVAIIPVPANQAAVAEALSRTRISRVLSARYGLNGPGPLALLDVIAAVGQLICDCVEPGIAVDVNPVRVLPSTAIALDFAILAS